MLKKPFFSRYQKHAETRDDHYDNELRTRYYKASFNQLFESAEDLLRNDTKVKVTSVSKDHGEIAAEVNAGFPAFLIMTVITVKPYQTAVDFYLSTERFSVTGANPALKKEILRLYNKLDKAHTFIGTGKNAE
ncbi:hypothetical protein [Bacillus sp. FJAT-27251]|uniref:hypothetical protein n=1 Tax=Bacillus sp. FJAT-27251 TaxID=1684142 RepID=UPI0006A7624B|nr:hypothetical protein [Bacillus sp. FJAT-27251]